MKIDSHQHFWQYDPIRYSWITDEMSLLKRDFLPEALNRELGANDIDASIAVQADHSEGETLFLLGLAGRYHTIAGVVGWLDITAEELPERLNFFSKFEKLRGLRHIVQAEPDDQFMLREAFVLGISRLSEFNLSYDILVYPRQLPAAIGLVNKFPGQRFVVDHIAKPPIKTNKITDWAENIRRLAEAPNVCCKLSGLVTEADWRHWNADQFRPYLDIVFEAFGPDRIMFGSDWPVCLLAGTYRQVKEVVEHYVRELPTQQREAIFGLNAARFYGLQQPHHGPAARY
jgi:L-fuconolactonase